MSEESDPATGVVVGDPAFEPWTFGALADDRQFEIGNPATSDRHQLEQQLESLDRRQPGDGDDARMSRLGDRRVEPFVDAVVDRPHPIGMEAEGEEFVAGRLRRGDDQRPPIERRRDPGLEQATGTPESAGQDLIPHRAVDVVDDHQIRPTATPHR